ncbi:MAG: DUF1361 domain-containing protein [Candidatus Moranbacteria bacterium]|nr:DUF1361 domain-containing protein [Candidatus Moranbacteria bacterium]
MKYKLMAASIYAIASFILGFSIQNGLIVFLGWNMILSTIPYLIAQSIKGKKRPAIIGLLGFLYVIFFPNSIYMTTDFIHFQNYTYFLEYPNIYAFNIQDWVIFSHVLIGVLLAIKLGMDSVNILRNTVSTRYKIFREAGTFLLFLLSSGAIFIGRFLRFNSWEVFKIRRIFEQIWQEKGFFFQFILLYLMIHIVLFFIFKEKKEPKGS